MDDLIKYVKKNVEGVMDDDKDDSDGGDDDDDDSGDEGEEFDIPKDELCIIL